MFIAIHLWTHIILILFFGSYLITDSISLLAIIIFTFSISSGLSIGRVNVSENLSIHSRFSNFGCVVVHSILYDPLYFCGIGCNLCFLFHLLGSFVLFLDECGYMFVNFIFSKNHLLSSLFFSSISFISTLFFIIFFLVHILWGGLFFIAMGVSLDYLLENPLQYSCLENPMDGGAWWATVHGSQRVGHDWVTSFSFFLSLSL